MKSSGGSPPSSLRPDQLNLSLRRNPTYRSLEGGLPPLSPINMKFEYKAYLIAGGLVALIIAIVIAIHLWSNARIASLEREIETAKATAEEKQTAAAALETEAAEYKAKTEYLEQQIAAINAIATKQNEELEKLSKTTDSARRDVERARNIRSVAATADQLCAKLADLGHPCQ